MKKNSIRTGSGYLFDFYNEIFLRVYQDVTNDGAAVFFAMIFYGSGYRNTCGSLHLKTYSYSTCDVTVTHDETAVVFVETN